MSEGKAWNDATVFWQQSESDGAEAALLVHVDNGGTLVINQDGQEIVLNRDRKNLQAFTRIVLAKAERP